MNEPDGLVRTAAELRRAFDASFARAPADAGAEVEDVLFVRVAGAAHAIRVRDIGGIVSRRVIVPLPAAAPGFLGLAGIRGEIVPVFGLSALLGYPADAEPPPWLVLTGGEEPIALGFSELEGYLRLPRSALHADDARRAARANVDEIATAAGARPVIALPLIVATIRHRLGRARPTEEHS